MAPRHRKQNQRSGPSGSYGTDDALAFESEGGGANAAAAAAAVATATLAPAAAAIRTNDQLNLAVLQRHYPEVTAILSIANFATLYTLHPAPQSWDKANCDGTLFVCALAGSAEASERYALIILNRRELKNFYFELLTPKMVEFEDPFLMLERSPGDVSGIFISAEPAPASTAQMRELNISVVQECAARAEESRLAASQWAGVDRPVEEGEEEADEETHDEPEDGMSASQYVRMDQTAQQSASTPWPGQQQLHPNQQFRQSHQQLQHADTPGAGGDWNRHYGQLQQPNGQHMRQGDAFLADRRNEAQLASAQPPPQQQQQHNNYHQTTQSPFRHLGSQPYAPSQAQYFQQQQQQPNYQAQQTQQYQQPLQMHFAQQQQQLQQQRQQEYLAQVQQQQQQRQHQQQQHSDTLLNLFARANQAPAYGV